MEELGNLARVPLEIQAVLDERVMTVSEILEWEQGSLIRMNRSAGENIQIRIGGVWVADGDILAVDDKICVRLTALRDIP
jgi:flagellar motor switch protein FliN/FliY